MLVKYKISDTKLDFVNKPMTAKTVYNTYKPTAFINACLYDMATSTNITNVKDETIPDGYLFTSEGIGIVNGKPKWTTLNDTTVQDFVAGSPILVKDSKVSIEWGNKVSTAIQGKAYRSSIGFNDKYIFLFTSDVAMTLQGLANYMSGQGCKYAINLDGGGSCHLQVGQKTYTKSTRKNASWIMLYQVADIGKVLDGKDTNVSTNKGSDKVKICLDAGHSAQTKGKRSPDSSLMEYEFNRDVGRRLRDILVRHGVEVIETVTDDDTDVSLAERCNIANKNNADYFVSIHANADGMGYNWTSAKGWEIHIVGKGGKAEKLAEAIHKHSIPILGLKDRGVRISNFQVLRDTDMPAVLIEHGFYTNKEECGILKTEEFRQKCAEADAKGILEFLGINYQDNKTEETVEKPIIDDWKVEQYQKALVHGIITDKNWINRLNDTVSAGEIFAMLNNLYDKIK